MAQSPLTVHASCSAQLIHPKALRRYAKYIEQEAAQ